jgi:hypothetical protein
VLAQAEVDDNMDVTDKNDPKFVPISSDSDEEDEQSDDQVNFPQFRFSFE